MTISSTFKNGGTSVLVCAVCNKPITVSEYGVLYLTEQGKINSILSDIIVYHEVSTCKAQLSNVLKSYLKHNIYYRYVTGVDNSGALIKLLQTFYANRMSIKSVNTSDIVLNNIFNGSIYNNYSAQYPPKINIKKDIRFLINNMDIIHKFCPLLCNIKGFVKLAFSKELYNRLYQFDFAYEHNYRYVVVPEIISRYVNDGNRIVDLIEYIFIKLYKNKSLNRFFELTELLYQHTSSSKFKNMNPQLVITCINNEGINLKGNTEHTISDIVKILDDTKSSTIINLPPKIKI